MSGGVLSLDDLEFRLDGTLVRLRVDGISREFTLRVVGEAEALLQVDAIMNSVSRGATLDDAIADAVAVRSAPRYMQRHSLPGAVTLLDDTHGATKDDTAAALRSLVQLATAGSRTVAVLGEFDCEPADLVEDHDAIGRLVVRLNVSQLVVVGSGARHVQSAAGLEGSWDGESVIVGTPEEAYDLLRDEIREKDFVLVKGACSTGLAALADRLVAAGAAS